MDASLAQQLDNIVRSWAAQGVSYLEMMVDSATGPDLGEAQLSRWDAALLAANAARNASAAQAALAALHAELVAAPGWDATVAANVDNQASAGSPSRWSSGAGAGAGVGCAMDP